MKTTIQVSDKIRSKLSKLKYDLGCNDYNEVLERIFGIISKFKLAKELEESSK